MIDKFKKTLSFIQHDIWRIPLQTLPKPRAFLYNVVRVLSLAVRGYKEDKIQQKASALTFYSLLSIVPVVAMGFGIAKGFGLEKKLEQELFEKFAGQEEVMNWVIKFSHSFLENTKGGLIAGIGVVLLIWSVMKVLGNIENSFNDIWQVQKSRVFVRKLSDYIAIMIVSVILLISSSSATIFISTQIKNITNQIDFVSFANPFISFIIQLIPYALVWMLFTLLYMVMPNTNVKFKSAVAAGIIAGLVFQFVQWGYIHFQVGVSRYGAIYGSFAAFPLFLVWLQLSWLIVLFGAEISFASQNVSRYEFESDTLNISLSHKRTITLLMASIIIKNFEKGGKAFTATEISTTLQIPIRLVRQILYEMVAAGLLVESIADNRKEHAYHPATDIHKLSLGYVIHALEDAGSSNISVKRTKEFEKLVQLNSKFRDKILNMEENLLLKDI